jgi:hypothetical protein
MIKNFIFVALALCLNLISLAQAQPVSIAGIYPGKTTLDELRDLVENPNKVENINETHMVSLKSLDNILAFITSHDEIVYEVSIVLDLELSVSLNKKYGKPRRSTGEIKKIVCRNGFGAKFDRLNGERREFWNPKEGVQAVLVHTARGCAEDIYSEYIIYNIAMKKKVESARNLETIKEIESKINKLNKGI